MAEWKYLWSEAFKTRYAIAAWLLRDVPYVLEIGGYKTPISYFLRPDQKSISIDPRTEPYKDHRTEHVSASFDANTSIVIPDQYGMAILGLDLGMSQSGWEKLFNLINGAKRTVIEIAVEHPTSVSQLTKITANTNTKNSMIISMDFSENIMDLDGSSPPHFEREIYLLESV